MIPTAEEITRELDWVPLKRYLELYGESKAAVLKRIAGKHWRSSEQYSRPSGGGLWVSIKGVNAWAKVHVPEKG